MKNIQNRGARAGLLGGANSGSFLFLLFIAAIGAGVGSVAEAIPPSCSTAGNYCTAPLLGPWQYTIHPGYVRPPQGPFDSQAEAIASVPPLFVSSASGHWCSMAFTSVTQDTSTLFGPVPYMSGNIDLAHGNNAYYNVTAYQPACNLSWTEDPDIWQERAVSCPTGMTFLYDGGNPANEPYCLGTRAIVNKSKAQGSCPADGSGLTKGNPCDVTHGNKHEVETDYAGFGDTPLSLTRHYNSFAVTGGNGGLGPWGVTQVFGAGWSANYFQRLGYSASLDGSTLYESVFAVRPDGRTLIFNRIGSAPWTTDGDAKETLASVSGGYELRLPGDVVESYDAAGRLTAVRAKERTPTTLSYVGDGLRPATISDGQGHTLQFTYTWISGSPRVTKVTDPAGGEITYTYNASKQLTRVTYQDGKFRQYGYDSESQLTSLTDEAGVVYATWTYYYNRIIGSQLAGGVDAYTFSYDGNYRTVTDPRGVSRTYTVATAWSVNRLTGASGTCEGCAEDKARTYDANGNVASRKDFKNQLTCYVFDSTRNLETTRVEGFASTVTACPASLATYTPASGTRERKITTQWHPTLRVPTLITEAHRTTGFTYDSGGNWLTRTVTDTATATSRTWTRTYDSAGRLLTDDGSRTDVSDVTTYTYYTCTSGSQCGHVATVTNALGQVTTYDTYDAHGQPLTITDPNGMVTTLTYDSRQRLTSRSVGGETTTIEYWPTGLLKKTTLPDSSYVLYTYDGAHRLFKIEDSAGNRIQYTLDAMGKRTAENTYDPSNALRRTHTQVFNSLNQLWKDVNAAGTAAVTTVFSADDSQNITGIAAPLSRTTTQQFDELNRLQQITDPALGVTQMAYDASDNLTSVTDPKGLVTSYQYNGFGDLKQQTSPDTGVTTQTFDSAGNVWKRTDARAAVATHTYDALNRLVSAAYGDQTIVFGYDAGTNGKGRLTSASDSQHSQAWTYDAQGRVIGKGQTVGGVTQSVGYGYANGRLSSMTLPSGQVITYGYGADGQVASVSIGGTTLLSQVLYEPFGPIRQWTWGNNSLAVRTYDTDYKIVQIDSAGLKTYGYDDAFRITGITDTMDAANSWTYGYDGLDRLSSAARTGVTRGWTYDANGNRLSETGTTPLSFTYATSPASNRLASSSGALVRSYSYDASGNALTWGSATATYNKRGRLKSLKVGTATRNYIYDSAGKMVRASGGPGGTVLYVHDEAGHLIGEYGSAGALVQETVWLGDLPVATLRPKSGGGVDIFYVHADHLGTPRRVTRPSDNKARWSWNPDPFGVGAPNQNPQALGNFVYNLRMPGQTYDPHGGLLQNHHRDYDPVLGRYVESDPIGLAGEINTYAYVDNSPVVNTDPLGLAPGRTKFPPSYYLKECDSADWKECEAKCSPNRALTCKRRFNRRLVGMRNDNPIFNFAKADLYCNCDDPGFCKSNPKTCAAGLVIGVGVAICLAPEIAVPGLIVGATAQ